MTLPKIMVKWKLIFDAITRDLNFSYINQTPYLDIWNGLIIWIYDQDIIAEWYGFNPEENKYYREQIESYPNRYLILRSFSQGGYRLILWLFVNSNWTDNKRLRSLVRNYFQNFSVNEWTNSIRKCRKIDIDPENIIDLWNRFAEDEMKIMMERYLKENDVDYRWC